jgi:hypothetical protein
MIQRYLHNDLNISYKDVLNVEILYTEKGNSILPDNCQLESKTNKGIINSDNVQIGDKKDSINVITDINESIVNVITNVNDAINTRIIHRYPNEGRSIIDFQATILDTFIDCELKRENITDNDKQMYIIVMVSNNTSEKKNIGELVNRYLFIENRESREYKYSPPSVSIHRRRILPQYNNPQYNNPNYIENTPFYPYNNNNNNNNSNNWSSIFSEPFTNSQVTSDEQKQNYSNRIQELEQERERELNNIRQAFFQERNRRTSIFAEAIPQLFTNNFINDINEDNNEDNNDINPSIFLSDRHQTFAIENLVHLLRFFTEESLNIRNIDNLMEPVRITVSENEIATFLTSFKFSDSEEYKRIKIKEQTNCPICLSNYENDEMVSYLNTCNHLFHTTCISTWLTEFNHKCPVCRLSANPSKNNEISPNVSSNEQNTTHPENLTDNEMDDEMDDEIDV